MQIADNLVVEGTLTTTGGYSPSGNITAGNISASALTVSGLTTLSGDVIETNANFLSTGNLAMTGNTTLSTIPGLSATVAAGGVYNLRIRANGSSTTGGGVKMALGGNATATNLNCTTWNYNGTTLNAVTNITALASNLTAGNVVFTDVITEGSITVNAGGSLTVVGAQNTSNGNVTTFLGGGCSLELFRVS